MFYDDRCSLGAANGAHYLGDAPVGGLRQLHRPGVAVDYTDAIGQALAGNEASSFSEGLFEKFDGVNVSSTGLQSHPSKDGKRPGTDVNHYLVLQVALESGAVPLITIFIAFHARINDVIVNVKFGD